MHDAPRSTVPDAQPPALEALNAPCWLAPATAGLLQHLSPATSAPERLLLEWLLLQGRPTALHWPALVQALNLPRAAIAHCLLALLRAEALTMQSLSTAEEHWLPQGGLAQLPDELHSWAQAEQQILLASHDGLPLASTGWTAYESSQLAAGHGALPTEIRQQPLQLGRLQLRLLWTGELDRQHPALLRWLLRLLQPQTGWLPRSADSPHAHTTTAAAALLR